MTIACNILIFSLCIVSAILLFLVFESNLKTLRSNIERHSFHIKRSRIMDELDTIAPLCDERSIKWIVTSYAGDAAPRNALRHAYSSEELRRLHIQRIFLLGSLVKNEETAQVALYDEAGQFGDILQGNFVDNYRNLTLKHLMGLRWIGRNCKNADFIIKMDDDIAVDLYEISNFLRNRSADDDLIMGYVLKNMAPARDITSKWFVTREEFPLNVYPDFVSGWLYITTPKVAENLVNYSMSYDKLFWIDDAFVTGILREQLLVKLMDIPRFYATDYRYLECCMKDRVKRLKCDYAVGPNGGKVKLQTRFGHFSRFCWEYCAIRSKEYSVRNTCITAHETSKIQEKGSRGQAEPFKIR